MIRGALSACETRMGVAAPGCRAHKLPSSRAQPLACRVLRAARLKAALSVEPAAGASGGASRATSDTWLGSLFLRLLPGAAGYAPCVLYPAATLLSGLAAAYAPACVGWVAGLPLARALGVAPLLAHVATVQPWATLLSVTGSLLTALLAFFATPALDFVLRRDLRNPEEADEAQQEVYRWILYAYCPLHLATLAGVCHLICTVPGVSALAFLGATLSAGVAGGILFTAAHELLHGSSWVDRACAHAMLAAVGYMHWTEGHLAHHVKVATPEDPASARRGESLYAFIPRSVWGNLVDGYGAEARRLKKRGIPWLSLHNRMPWWLACPAALAGTALATYGWAGLAFAVGQAAISILMLETVNYIEHYGLTRTRTPDGRYERVGVQHSWNTSFMFTNAVSFRLQRHADHHLHGTKPYHLLIDYPEAPQLPCSYPAAMMLALVPPLYMRVMDPRCDEFEAQWAQRTAHPQPAAA